MSILVSNYVRCLPLVRARTKSVAAERLTVDVMRIQHNLATTGHICLSHPGSQAGHTTIHAFRAEQVSLFTMLYGMFLSFMIRFVRHDTIHTAT